MPIISQSQGRDIRNDEVSQQHALSATQCNSHGKLQSTLRHIVLVAVVVCDKKGKHLACLALMLLLLLLLLLLLSLCDLQLQPAARGRLGGSTTPYGLCGLHINSDRCFMI